MKEEKQRRECTFIPILNPKSVRMCEKIEQEDGDDIGSEDHALREEEIEYEYSNDELVLQESSQQLFNNQRFSSSRQTPASSCFTQKLKGQKYSYSHSYTSYE